jgi:rRNA maturation endonuclease Nob1
MSFIVVCQGCGKILYEGRDMIPLYRLRRKTEGKCPSCGRKLAVDPLSIKLEEKGL